MNKEQLLHLLGPFPVKSELNVLTLESIDCGTYIREKIEYSVEKDERVRAYILLPKNKLEKTPAIFCHHQHGRNFEIGKSEVVGLGGDSDQAYAVELAELGYVTFATDAIAFEERNWSKDKSAQVEYFELSTRLIKGQTLLAKALHDIAVGIDYLQSRKEVDAKKIGFIGHSYGGRMAIWAPAIDKRIKVSVSNCGCINYKNSLNRNIGVQMEFCVPGIMQIGDVEDVVRMVEPANLLISATDDDKWSYGAEEVFNSATSAFKEGELCIKLWPGKHIFNKEMRTFAYSFINKHLSKNSV
jgi:dienelactone hydrolase